MNRWALAGALAGVLGLSVACSTMKVNHDYDHTIDWSRYRTFMLKEGTKDPVTFSQKRIDEAITSTLQSKGWQATTSSPDILVYTHTVLTTEKQWTATSMGGWGYYGWYGGGGVTTATQTTIPIGTLIVDLVDSKTHEMIWRGTAQDQVSSTGADKGQIEKAMKRLFEDFPPTAK